VEPAIRAERVEPEAAPRRRRRALLALLVFAAAVRLANLGAMSRLPIAEIQLDWPDADMAFFYDWAGRILAGDVLGRDTPHPYKPWMAEVAPLETWERWWGGRQVFHSAPLFPYLLAGARRLVGDGFRAIALLQLAVGVAGVWLVYRLAETWLGARAALFAGAISAVYSPGLLYESLALRDPLGATASLALLLALSRCGPDARTARWVVAGLLLAVALLAREATTVFLPFLAVWLTWTFRARPRRLPLAALGFAGGALLGLAPLIARNVAVGAPPLALSSVGTLGFVYGHVADASPALFELTPMARDVLLRSDGSFRAAVPLVWSTYGGDWWLLVSKEAERLAGALASFEPWDNANWYYFRERSPMLRWALPFDVVAALGIVGVWLTRRSPAPLLLAFLAASLATLAATSLVGRYRLPLVSVLCVYAGATVARATHAASMRRWGDLAAVVLAVAILAAAAHVPLADLATNSRERPIEYALAARTYLLAGDHDRAEAELVAGVRAAQTPARPALVSDLDWKLAQALANDTCARGRGAVAAQELTALAAAYPQDGRLERLLGLVYRDCLARPDEANRHFEGAQRLGAP